MKSTFFNPFSWHLSRFWLCHCTDGTQSMLPSYASPVALVNLLFAMLMHRFHGRPAGVRSSTLRQRRSAWSSMLGSCLCWSTGPVRCSVLSERSSSTHILSGTYWQLGYSLHFWLHLSRYVPTSLFKIAAHFTFTFNSSEAGFNTWSGSAGLSTKKVEKTAFNVALTDFPP